jgi:L-lactate utilization protein LutB
LDSETKEALKNLKRNGFDAKFAENNDAVKEIILTSIPKNATVGVGDSATIRQIRIIEELEKKGIRVLNPFLRELTTDRAKTETRDDISRQVFSCNVLVSGTNAVTRDGKLVNVDAVGNRVASMIFGPRRVLVIVGKNKIVKNVNEALYRIKNLIAPFHARTKGFTTLCAQSGKCTDCSAPKRICSVTAIMEKRPWRTEVSIILVNEDLGLSWDETWPEERILKIKSNYEKVTWTFASAGTP